MGLVLNEGGKKEDALGCFLKAIELQPITTFLQYTVTANLLEDLGNKISIFNLRKNLKNF
jgi:hypothetical protein